jgi:hypothetical protein
METTPIKWIKNTGIIPDHQGPILTKCMCDTHGLIRKPHEDPEDVSIKVFFDEETYTLIKGQLAWECRRLEFDEFMITEWAKVKTGTDWFNSLTFKTKIPEVA